MARTAVIAGTATAVSGRVARRQQARYQRDAEAEAYEQQVAPAAAYEPSYAPAPVASAPTSVEQLTQLAALRDQGVLTDAEFAAEKAKIIGG
jgi:hypothetical protein